METNLAAMEVTKANCEETLEKMRQSLQSAVFVGKIEPICLSIVTM